eukprot:1162096-Pelagomonas_calceolata.AAC.3
MPDLPPPCAYLIFSHLVLTCAGGGTDSGAGPSTSQAAGSGSLRGGLRGLLHPQEKSTRSTDKSARSTDKSARGRTSLSGGLRSKLVLPTPEDLTYDTACSACFSPSLVADGISPFQANDSCIESQTTGRSAVAC